MKSLVLIFKYMFLLIFFAPMSYAAISDNPSQTCERRFDKNVRDQSASFTSVNSKTYEVVVISHEPRLDARGQQVEIFENGDESNLEVCCTANIERTLLKLEGESFDIVSEEKYSIDKPRTYSLEKILPEVWGLLGPIYSGRRGRGDLQTIRIKNQDYYDLPLYRTYRVLVREVSPGPSSGKLITYLQVFDGSHSLSTEHHVVVLDLDPSHAVDNQLPVKNIAPTDGAFFLLPMERASRPDNPFFMKHRFGDRDGLFELGRFFIDRDPTSSRVGRFVLGWKMPTIVKRADQSTILAYSDRVGAHLFSKDWGFKSEYSESFLDDALQESYVDYFLSAPGESFLENLQQKKLGTKLTINEDTQ